MQSPTAYVPLKPGDLDRRAQRLRELNAQIIANLVGPRAPGVWYQSGYWGTLNLVLSVETDLDKGTAWITEISEDELRDGKLPRRHCTSWQYHAGNQIIDHSAALNPDSPSYQAAEQALVFSW